LKDAALSVIVEEDLTITILVVARRRFLGRDVAIGFNYDKPAIRRYIARIGSSWICRCLSY
jgi:hypothetical protein